MPAPRERASAALATPTGAGAGARPEPPARPPAEPHTCDACAEAVPRGAARCPHCGEPTGPPAPPPIGGGCSGRGLLLALLLCAAAVPAVCCLSSGLLGAARVPRGAARPAAPPVSLALTLTGPGPGPHADSTLRVAGRVAVTGATPGDVVVSSGVASCTPGPDGSFALDVELPEGEHELQVAARASGPGRSARAEATRTVVVDTTPPTLRLLAPAGVEVVAGDEVLLRAEALDAGPWVDLELAGAVSATLRLWHGEGEGVWRLGLPAGRSTFSVTPVDAAGNRGDAEELTVTLGRATARPAGAEPARVGPAQPPADPGPPEPLLDAPAATDAWVLRGPPPTPRPAFSSLLVALDVDLDARPAGWTPWLPATDLAAPEGEEVVLVRFASAQLGGNLDLAGKEDVVVWLRPGVGARPVQLLGSALDLPSTSLATYALGRAPFVALPPGPEHALEVVVEDDDLVGSDELTRGAVVVRLGDLPADEEVVLRVTGAPIPGVTGAPELALGVVRARVRGPDDVSRWALRRLLGFLLATPAPTTAAAATAAATTLPGALADARLAIACSTHTDLRAAGGRVLAALDGVARRLPRPEDEAAARAQLAAARVEARATARALSASPTGPVAPGAPSQTSPLARALDDLARATDLQGLRAALAAARAAPWSPGPPADEATRHALQRAALVVQRFDGLARARADRAAARAAIVPAWAAARAALEAELAR